MIKIKANSCGYKNGKYDLLIKNPCLKPPTSVRLLTGERLIVLSLNYINYEIFEIFDKKSVIGNVSVYNQKKCFYISHLRIEEEFRNKGYGKKLMQKICSIFKGEILKLDVVPDNDIAINMYKKLGFKKIGTGGDITKYIIMKLESQ